MDQTTIYKVMLSQVDDYIYESRIPCPLCEEGQLLAEDEAPLTKGDYSLVCDSCNKTTKITSYATLHIDYYLDDLQLINGKWL